MGRVTEETAYREIRGLLERGDFVTAEKLLKKFSQNLTENQRQELRKVQVSAGRRRSLTREWLRKLACHGGFPALFYLHLIVSALAK